MIVQDKGSPEAVAKGKKELKAGVKQMVTDGTLWADFGEWADHIREMGNASVHPETHDPVTIEEATDIRDLVRQLIEILYIQPAKVRRARAARSGS